VTALPERETGEDTLPDTERMGGRGCNVENTIEKGYCAVFPATSRNRPRQFVVPPERFVYGTDPPLAMSTPEGFLPLYDMSKRVPTLPDRVTTILPPLRFV
jgi:hypothetical protein